MNNTAPNSIALDNFIQAKILAKKPQGASIEPNENLIASGLFDSLDFIGLITELEEVFDLDLDFSDLDPNEFTTYAGLIRQLNKANY